MNEQQIIQRLYRMKGKQKWQDVAARLGIAKSTLSGIVRGKRKPGPKVYAAVLGRKVKELKTYVPAE